MNDSPQLLAVFCEARERRSAEARAAYLDEACRDDADLRARVEALLCADQDAGNFLQGDASQPKQLATVDDPITERPGTVIGPYKLLEQIGEGGFGVVFMAEQQQPIRRKVALKVIKPGMDTRQVVARFEAERQALAIMDHPNIAKVLDAGATGEPGRVSGEPGRVSAGSARGADATPLASGRPYFVMELVRGVPITEYCDQAQLTPRERLELFIPVCQAVQHAHQKGIIHRDIKPSNVMVTLHDGTPVPKIIDFGIAKAMGQQLTDKTLFTNFAQLIGTPLYMSPEQAGLSGLDVDTRSDIYSLGVLLYELLTGTTPFDKERFKEAGYDEIRRIIREEEPPKPSTRISTLGATLTLVSAQRNTDPRRLRQLFRGELDWIVMKCLEKDRNRRYETTSSLARDIERYLHDEPVQACPPSAGYRLRKFVRRNKTALIMAGLVALAVVVLAGSAGWNVHDRATRQAVLEKEQAALEKEVARSLEEMETEYRRDNLPAALAELMRAEGLLAGGGGSAELQQRVGQWRTDLKMVARLEEMRLEQSTLKGEWYDLARADAAYAGAFRECGIEVAAPDPAVAAERIRTSVISKQLVAALDDWISLKPRADSAGRERLRALARLADPDDWRNRFRDPGMRRDRQALKELAARPEVAKLPPSTVVLLGRALIRVGDGPKAVEVLAAAQRRFPADFWLNIELAWSLSDHIQPARFDEAAGYARAALAVRPNEAMVYARLGNCLHTLRMDGSGIGATPAHIEEAIAAYRRAIELRPDFAHPRTCLGYALHEKGLWDAAVAAHKAAVRLAPSEGGPHYGLLLALRAEGLEEEALAANKETVRLAPHWSGGHIQLGRALWGKGLRQEAIAAYEEAVRILRLPEDDVGGDYSAARNELAWNLATSPDGKLRDPQRAVELAGKAVEFQPKIAGYWMTLGWAQYRTGNWRAAVTALEKVKEIGSAGDSLEWFPLAMAHWRLGNKPAARKYYDQAVQWMEKDARKNDQLRSHKVATYRDKHAAYGQTLGPDLKNVDLRHLRAEAEELLGIQKKN